MILKIPKLKSAFIKNGFDKLHYHAMFEPTRILGQHNDQIYLDCVLIAILAHAKQSKKVLDLGSYFGMLPFVVEDLYRVSDLTSSIKWTLVDNCLYVKEMRNYISGHSPLSQNFMSMAHAVEWQKANMPKRTQQLFESTETCCLPPASVEQFQSYWQKLANDYLEVPCPDMTMYETLDELDGEKFDLVGFDLSAGQYNNSKLMFDKMIKHVTDDAIIIIDDITPSHPESMAFFNYVMKTYNYLPIAFSPGKVAVMNPSYKEEFLLQANRYITINELDLVDPNFYCSYKNNEIWGPYLQLHTAFKG